MPNSQKGIVYVVDDDPAVLKLLQALVESIGVDVRAFASAGEFLNAYLPSPCGCLVCDLRMPDIDGLELQKRLISRNGTLPIIFVTGFAEVGIAVEAMRQGAFDFIEKPFSMQALLGKIQAALEHSRVSYDKWREQETKQARLALLSSRENSVLRNVVDGRSSREISAVLGISVRTVENHRTRIMEKLHAGSTVELVRLCL